MLKLFKLKPGKFCPQTLILLLLLCCQGFSLAVKPPPTSKQTKTNVNVTLNFTANNKPIPVMVKLYDSSGRSVFSTYNKKSLLAVGKLQLKLQKGDYNLTISASPRLTIWQSLLQVRDKNLERTIILEDFFPLQAKGWIIVDPFVTSSQKPDRESLATCILRAKAAGVNALGKENLQSLKSRLDLPFSYDPGGELLRKECEAAQAQGVSIFASKIIVKKPLLYDLKPNAAARPRSEPVINYGGLQGTLRPCLQNKTRAVWAESKPNANFLFTTLSGPLYSAFDASVSKFNFRLWLLLLKLGYRIPALGGVGGTKISSPDSAPSPAMYLQQASRLSPRQILTSLFAGKTIVSNGPFISLNSAGHQPGDTLQKSEDPRQIIIQAFSSSRHQDSIKRIEIIYNGQVKRHFKGIKNQRSMLAADVLRCDKPGYILARYVSQDPEVFAFTNPVYIGDNSSHPLIPTTKLFIKTVNNRENVSCLAEVWNYDQLLGRYSVPTDGATLELPITARINLINLAGEDCGTYSIYEASGAAAFERHLQKNKNKLKTRLLNSKTYNAMRKILEHSELEINLEQLPR